MASCWILVCGLELPLASAIAGWSAECFFCVLAATLLLAGKGGFDGGCGSFVGYNCGLCGCGGESKDFWIR